MIIRTMLTSQWVSIYIHTPYTYEVSITNLCIVQKYMYVYKVEPINTDI